MLTKNLLTLSLLILIACAREQTSGFSVPTEGSAAVTPTPGAETTQAPMVTQIEFPPTAVPEIENLPIEQVVQFLINGKIDYPFDFSDEKKKLLSVLIADYLNQNVMGDEVYISRSFDNIGQVKIGWNPAAERWVSNHNTSEALIDFGGKSLPPVIIPGYTNSEGQEVFIDPESGKETTLGVFNLPELGQVSLTDLVNIDPNEIEERFIIMALGAKDMDPYLANCISSSKFNPVLLPVVLYKNARSNVRYYQNIFSVTTEYSQVPEADTSFVDQLTNSVLTPFVDRESNHVIFWLNIQQGIQWAGMRSFVYSSNISSVTFARPSTYSTWANNIPQLNDKLFGLDPSHSVGILALGTQENTVCFTGGEEPLLEGGVGIGAEDEISSLLRNAGDLETAIEFLRDFRLLVIYPYMEIHQSSN